MLIELTWESYEIAWRFWGPQVCQIMGGHLPPWVNTWGVCEIWKGGKLRWWGVRAQMKYHECMHLGGQQQFHATHSFYMKVVLRSLNVLNAIVCSSCCWFLSIVRVPFSNIFKDCTVPKGCFFRLSLGLKMVEVCGSNPTLPIPQCSFGFFFKKIKRWDPKSYGVRCFQQSYSQGTDLAERNCRDSLFFTSP